MSALVRREVAGDSMAHSSGGARRLRTAFLALASSVLLAACATARGAPDRTHIDEALRARTGKGLRPGSAASPLPPGVSLDDGISEEEAVAVALWNSPTFAASLADLGVARADLVEAGLLRNPVLSLLFPWGPKQLEWTLQFPVDAIWQRPRRVATAKLNAQVVAERLVSQGLTVIADVRQAYVDAAAGERRLALASENAALAKGIADIAEARLKAGDISELEARAARADAAQVNVSLKTLAGDADVAKVTLATHMGIDMAPEKFRIDSASTGPGPTCSPADSIVRDAMAARPDVRAAELAIEAAGQRAKWERTRVLRLIALLDANQEGREGFEMGPGVTGEIPIFSRNQGGASRAMAELERASRNYAAVRLQVAAEVRIALIRLAQARQSVEIWDRDILPSLEIEQRQAERAYKGGELPLLSLLDVSRRNVQARTSRLEALINVQKAAVAVERSVGRRCGGS